MPETVYIYWINNKAGFLFRLFIYGSKRIGAAPIFWWSVTLCRIHLSVCFHLNFFIKSGMWKMNNFFSAHGTPTNLLVKIITIYGLCNSQSWILNIKYLCLSVLSALPITKKFKRDNTSFRDSGYIRRDIHASVLRGINLYMYHKLERTLSAFF